MNNQIITVAPRYGGSQQYYFLISKKRKIFLSLNKRFEKLSEEINTIQAEYDMRIGSLLRKISILDYEIEKYSAALRLVKKGVGKKEALETADTEIKNQYKKERDNFWEYFEGNSGKNIVSEDAPRLIRRLWKKLAQKYHPDLSDNLEEKGRREQIMKMINMAYAKQDFETLRALEDKDVGEVEAGLDVDTLEQVLVDIENACIRIQKALQLLKKSEWYFWRNKSRKEKNNHFADLEGNFIREMIRKEFVLSDLKKALQ